MNENSHKISAAQLFCILLLMRVTAELVYPTSGGFGGSGVLAVLTAELIRFLLALPVLIVCLLFAGGMVLLLPVALIALAWGILKACV